MDVFTYLVCQKVLIWIDDILAFYKTCEDYIITSRPVFTRLLVHNVKSNPTKTGKCAPEIAWSCRGISGRGAKFDPVVIQRPTNLEEPRNAGQLK